MAETVGERGAVLATDLNLDWVGPEIPPNVELRRHDVTTDAIPSSAYDLIHARLVLVHLPERGSIIPRLVEALAPGGWLVLEEFCAGFPNYPDPATDDEQAFARVFDVFRELLQRRGADTGSYPRTLPWRLQRLGLAHVGAEGRLVFGQGATAAATLMRANLRQTGALAVESGLVSVDDIAASLRLLDDPDCTFALPLMVSAWGQRGPR
jgi:hypothetical protein